MGRDVDVVCIGHATLDRIVLVQGRPPRDGRVFASDYVEAGGGPAATAGVTLARLGRRVAIVGAVGDDATGRRIRDELAGCGVDVDALELSPGARSPTSVIVVDREAATRTIVAYPGSVGPLRISPRTFARCQRAAWVHVDHRGYDAIAMPRHGIRPASLSVDAGHPLWPIDLPGVDLFAPSLAFLRARYRGMPRDLAMRAALREGTPAVVVTDGVRGSWARSADGRWHAAAHPVDAFSTLGAGDVFHGALLDARLDGLSWPDALRRANVAAALSCRALDGRSAIPDVNELRAAMAHATARPVVRSAREG
jgi:sulfofructose kinase